jgi:hypothetical protein
MKTILCLLAAALLCGCVSTTPITKEQLEQNCGPEPVNYQAVIKDYFHVILKDPDSALYKCMGAPRRDCLRESLLSGGKLRFGWLVDFEMNAKNSYGGYNGYEFYQFLIRNEQVIGVKDKVGIWELIDPTPDHESPTVKSPKGG